MHNSTNDKLCVCTPTKRVVVIHIRLVLSYLFLVVVYWEMFKIKSVAWIKAAQYTQPSIEHTGTWTTQQLRIYRVG